MSGEAKVPVEAVPAVATQKKQLSNVGGFIAGGLAACGAVTVTNPIELIKTRYVFLFCARFSPMVSVP